MLPIPHSQHLVPNMYRLPTATKTADLVTEKKIAQINLFVRSIFSGLYRIGISITSILPLSKRGILFNLIRAPALIPLRAIQSSGPNFSQNLKAQLKKDWNQGISNSYVNLEKNPQLRRNIVNENRRYAAYIYMGIHLLRGRQGGENGLLLAAESSNELNETKENDILTQKPSLNRLIESLTQNMSFKVDSWGNFYNTKTGRFSI